MRGKSGLGHLSRGSPASLHHERRDELRMTGTVIGSLPGLAGNGPRIIFRILRVFEFGNGLISRENVWLDSAAVVDQLSRR